MPTRNFLSGKEPLSDRNSLSSRVHPASFLILWLFFLLAAQNLRGVSIAFAFLLFPLFGGRALRRGLLMAWRARWLLLPVFLIPAWSVAGKPLWNVADTADTAYTAYLAYIPTREGLNEASVRLGRLLLVLMSVGVALEKLPFPDLLSASRTLLKPVEHFGAGLIRRGLVRLLLAFRYAENLPRPKDWRALLESPVPAEEEWLEIRDFPLRRLDYSLISLGLLLLVAAFRFG